MYHELLEPVLQSKFNIARIAFDHLAPLSLTTCTMKLVHSCSDNSGFYHPRERVVHYKAKSKLKVRSVLTTDKSDVQQGANNIITWLE